MVAIVTVAVSQQVAPIPSTLQRTGAFISQGGTNTAVGKVSLLTELSDLTPLYNGSQAISAISWTGGVVSVTSAVKPGPTVGDVVQVTLAGFTPAGYNGTVNATVTSTGFTFPLATNPGSATITGMWTAEDVAELCAMATTFFAQGGFQAVFVLELGLGTPAEGVAALAQYIIANQSAPQPLPGNGSYPARFYAYMVPRPWAAEPTFPALCQAYQAPASRLYFWVTSTLATYQNFTSLNKGVIQLIEAPNIPVTEFSLAAAFQKALAYAPSATNKVTPFAFSFLYGVTPYPSVGNSAQLQTFKNAAVNIVGTGAEGGISNTILLWGTTMDGNDFTYWYSADWTAINLDLSLANAIINGSNNPINPLYYNQDGIDRLEAVAASVMSRGVTFGLVLGTPIQLDLDGPDLNAATNAGTYAGLTVVNAVPFLRYSEKNPGDYAIGQYNGISVTYVPARGFIAIRVNLVVSDFPSS